MARTEGEKISRYKYESKAYDQILLKVKKGKREEYKTAAAERGLGQMEMIRAAIEEYISNHAGAVPATTPTPAAETLTADEKQLLAAFAKCPENMRPTLKKLVEQVAALVDEKGGDSNGND